jgi:hypothetical protein
MNEQEFPELPPGKSHIFLQALDISCGLVTGELYCGSPDVSRLANALGCDVGEFTSSKTFYLEEGGVQTIKSFLSIDQAQLTELSLSNKHGEISFAVQVWNPSAQLPFRVHTNRELILMLENKKPFSVFVGRIPPDTSFEEIPEHLFDPHVASGAFCKQELREECPDPVHDVQGHRIVLYARAEERWRIRAYSMVRHLGNRIGWSEPLTRLEGTLLGYSDWQNDAFIAHMKKHI